MVFPANAGNQNFTERNDSRGEPITRPFSYGSQHAATQRSIDSPPSSQRREGPSKQRQTSVLLIHDMDEDSNVLERHSLGYSVISEVRTLVL